MSSESNKPTSLKHELRTPLNHIIGYCEMLMEEAEDQKLTQFTPDLQRIHTAGRRLLGYINDLFDPAQEEAAAFNEHMLHHEIRTPLNQIIGYTEMLEEECVEHQQETLVPDIRKIHSAAHQLLGLVMDRLVPERFGNQAETPELESTATTFMRKSASGSEEGEGMGTVTGKGVVPSYVGRLLVVDDNELNRDMLTRRLTRLGYEVEEAENGQIALDKLNAGDFDLVLLDIMMPVMNGYQVLDSMNQNVVLRSVPVIVLSASDETHKITRCIEMGAEDYLPKPFDPALLQTRINASLEKKRLRDQEVSYLKQIQEEKKRSDELLHVILPSDVATELKDTNGVLPRRYENVGVLFCDVAGFTAYCEKHPPEQVLQHLQALVESYELLTFQFELEKIKTIGDSFMATAGLLEPLENPALNCVRCGLAMIATANTLPAGWKVRVGIHLGPVIAGVVGHRKYQYDIWGDTVNTAARMEHAATPGSICVNDDTWRLVEPHCQGHSLGRVEIKGKGQQELYQVEGLL